MRSSRNYIFWITSSRNQTKKMENSNANCEKSEENSIFPKIKDLKGLKSASKDNFLNSSNNFN